MTSARYAQEFNEVKAVGAKNSTKRTAEQAAIAMLWQPTSPITYNAMLRAMPELKQKSIVEQARVFALLNMAASDAFIVGWRDKYLFLFWRPETAIRNADSDGNDATSADATWEGLHLPVPSTPGVSLRSCAVYGRDGDGAARLFRRRPDNHYGHQSG